MLIRIASSVIVLLVVVVSAGCGDAGNPARPSPPRSPLLGRWTGSMVDNTAGTGAAVLVLNEQLDMLTLRGTWESTFSDVSANESGMLTATVVDETSLVIYMAPSIQPPCGSITVRGVIGVVGRVNGNRLTGEYVSPRCGTVKSGSLELTKQ